MPKMIANLGDVNPIDHGGFFVYDDGIVEVLDVPDDWDDLDDESAVDERPYGTIWRFDIDRCTYENGVLSNNPYRKDTPAWWAKYIKSIASYCDIPEGDLIKGFCSEDLIKRAVAYLALFDYCGRGELDSDPLTLTKAECEERYREWDELLEHQRGGA